MLERLKVLLRDELGIPPLMILIVAGLLSYFLLNALLRKPLTSAWGLLAPVCCGIALESYEIWVHYKDLDRVTESPGSIAIRHLGDVLAVCAVPALITLTGAMKSRTGHEFQ